MCSSRDENAICRSALEDTNSLQRQFSVNSALSGRPSCLSCSPCDCNHARRVFFCMVQRQNSSASADRIVRTTVCETHLWIYVSTVLLHVNRVCLSRSLLVIHNILHIMTHSIDHMPKPWGHTLFWGLYLLFFCLVDWCVNHSWVLSELLLGPVTCFFHT